MSTIRRRRSPGSSLRTGTPLVASSATSRLTVVGASCRCPASSETLWAPSRSRKGNEADLIAALTDAVAGVYGEWEHDHVVVLLNGIPAGRWGRAGKVVESAAPIVEFGIREEAFSRPDADRLAPAIMAAVTNAIASVLGEEPKPTCSSN
jgi:phenylpyruvate tautomerase PptA (4-oxalocrotonate tautomerase family)